MIIKDVDDFCLQVRAGIAQEKLLRHKVVGATHHGRVIQMQDCVSRLTAAWQGSPEDLEYYIAKMKEPL